MHAVILTGGKQYRVKPGDVLSVEKLETEAGRKVSFSRVLLIEEDGGNVLLGTPLLEDAMVRAEVLELYKDEKVLVFKKKRRKQYRRTRGHRQQLTRIRVEGIYPDKSQAPAEEAPEAKPAPAPAPAPKAEPKAPVKPEAPAKKPAGKPRKPAKKTTQAPQAKTVGKKTAGAKPAAKPKKAAKE